MPGIPMTSSGNNIAALRTKNNAKHSNNKRRQPAAALSALTGSKDRRVHLTHIKWALRGFL